MIYYHTLKSKHWYETWAWPKDDIEIHIESLGKFIVAPWYYNLKTRPEFEKQGFNVATKNQLRILIRMLFLSDWTIEDKRK
jgi:hypothetical protein